MICVGQIQACVEVGVLCTRQTWVNMSDCLLLLLQLSVCHQNLIAILEKAFTLQTLKSLKLSKNLEDYYG